MTMLFARLPRLRSLAAAVMVASAGCAALSMAPVTAQAQSVQRIAAVVNDSIISVRDVENRLALLLSTSNTPDTAQTRRQLLPRVVRSLIDERLKMQEAERLGLSAAREEIEDAKRQIESSNRMPQGALDQIMARAGVPIESLEDQIRADVVWMKVVRRTLVRDVFVEDQEIDAVLETMRRNLGKPEQRVSEILFSVDPTSVSGEDQAQEAARRLAEDLRNGADFASVARQFSSAATAGAGGDLGWVTQGTLASELEQALAGLQEGGISNPIRTTTGYTILKLHERRTPSAPDPANLKVRLSQLYMPTSGPAAVSPEVRQDAMTRVAGATSCEDVNALAAELNLPSSGDVGTLPPAQLPPAVGSVVAELPVDTLSRPISMDGAEVVVMVCERENPDGLPSREDIRTRLGNTKVERAAQRALRDLRNAALIDIRL